MTEPTRDFWIDTDTASDDAVALIMALRHPGVAVRGITTVAGNVPVAQATANALFVAELCGSDVPVHVGCDRPMLRPAVDANWFHGRDGLSDLGFAPTRGSAAAGHAVDALLEATRRHPGLTLVTLGPLTNVAVAVLRDPSLAGRVGRCVVMGGNPCCAGNVTPAAEYNVWCDPEAAEVVLRSGMPVDLAGWHLSRGDAALDAADIARARDIDTPLARFAIDCNRTAAAAYRVQTGEVGISLPDPVAMAVALDPDGVVRSASRHLVAVECHSELTRGQTVVDRLNVASDARNAAVWSTPARTPPARVVWSIDISAFKRLLFAALQR
jgi:purine nucleosidase